MKSEKVVIVSNCMHANSTIIAMSKTKELFKDATCLVAIQPVSADVFISAYVKDKYTPAGLVLIPLADRLCQWRGG